MINETRTCIERSVYSKTHPFTFVSKLNQKYTTVLSLSLSLSTSLIYFWSVNIDMSKNCEGMEVGVWDGKKLVMLLVNIVFVKQNINYVLFILFTKLVNCTFAHFYKWENWENCATI